ncbi:MAG: transcriptional regulator with XRE-family HTH domain [Granulosicoccus sp.]|jgi:transcriptional regulator with XRE-family HTH domain
MTRVQTLTRDGKLSLAIRIARLRKTAGLTLAQLARACELSEVTLSRIENGLSQVSAHHLFLLAQVFGVDIADFFRQDAEPLMKGIHPAINHIRAKTLDEVVGYSAHNGEEFLFVLSGSIALHSNIYTPTILNAGYAMYFEGSMNHAYLNAGDRVATILVVVGPGGKDTV